MKETFLSELTAKDVRTSARVLLFGAVGPFVAATPFGVAGGGATAVGAFFALNSSAHDLGAAGFGGDALGVSSALALTSAVGAEAPSALVDSSRASGGDLTDRCVVEAALGALAGLMGMRGTAGFVVLRVCFVTVADD